MRPQRLKRSGWIVIAICTYLLFILVKLFTAEVRYVDDPTVSLVVRSIPSLSNYLIVKETNETEGMYFLLSDEGDYIGSDLYAVLISMDWLVSCLVLGVILFAYSRRRNSPRRAQGR